MIKTLFFILLLMVIVQKNELHAQTPTLNAHQLSLIQMADNSEFIRVIIELRLPTKTISWEDKNAISAYREEITTIGNALIERNTEWFEYVRTFENFPLIGLVTDREGLLAIFDDADVLSVSLDELSQPFMNVSNEIIGSPVIWDLGFTGEGTAVAVLDTGVDSSHPHFGTRVVTEACFSTTFSGHGATTLCPNGNNPSGFDSQFGAGAGVDCDVSISGCGHGTHVAGTVAGSSVNAGRPINGVAKDASLIAIQVFSEFDYQHPENFCGNNATSNCVLSYTGDQIAALDWILSIKDDYNIVAANMSLGGGGFTSVCDDVQVSRKTAIDNLKAVNIATIIASGNNGFKNAISAPACISTAISVGSTQTGKYSGTSLDAISSFSNSATFLDLLAPGHFIESAVPNNGYGGKAGTSMAAPHVAGAWALYRQAFPNATVDEVLAALSSHGVPLTDSNGITKPRLQIDESMLNTQTTTSIAGDNVGWRLLGSPIQQTTYSDLFSSIWTQGFPGSNSENGDPTVFVYSEATRSYSIPNDASHTIGTTSPTGNSAGKAVYVYVFEDDDFDGIPDVWPKPLVATGVPNIGDINVPLSRTLPDDGSIGWHLISNPFPYALDWSDVFDDAANIHAHAYVWNPNRIGGADYINTDGDWNGIIAPFQAFWVRAVDDNAEITFRASQASQLEATLFQEPERIGFTLSLETGSSSTWTSIFFDDEKALKPEVFNAYRLTSLSPSFIYLYTSDDNNDSSWLTNYQSFYDFTSAVIPLHVASAHENTFSLRASDFNLPADISVSLIDHLSDATIRVDETFHYSFSLENSQVTQTNPKPDAPYLGWMHKDLVTTATNKEMGSSRFSLVINRLATNVVPDNDLPVSFRLGANYPNPFNPTTRIEFDVPESTHVRLEVFSITGQHVATMVNEIKQAGTHQILFDASHLSSGVYLYRLQAGTFIQTQKMTLIK